MKVIRCEQLSKSYGHRQALQQVTCAIDGQKIVGIIGRNGAGKSTLLHIFSGHIKATNGTCQLFDQNPFNNIRTAANTILIDDQLSFSNYLSLSDILTMAADFYPNWQNDLAYRLLQYAEIDLAVKHQQLSKGHRAIFNVVYGLVARCAFTILDEPMNGMDEAIRQDFYRVILKEYIAFPRTILIASHHLQEMETILEEILLLHKGKIITHATIDELREQLISLTGPNEEIDALCTYLPIYARKTMANLSSIIVDAYQLKLSHEELQARGITQTALSVSDVCKYLTYEEGSDIDAIFD